MSIRLDTVPALNRQNWQNNILLCMHCKLTRDKNNLWCKMIRYLSASHLVDMLRRYVLWTCHSAIQRSDVHRFTVTKPTSRKVRNAAIQLIAQWVPPIRNVDMEIDRFGQVYHIRLCGPGNYYVTRLLHKTAPKPWQSAGHNETLPAQLADQRSLAMHRHNNPMLECIKKYIYPRW